MFGQGRSIELGRWAPLRRAIGLAAAPMLAVCCWASGAHAQGGGRYDISIDGTFTPQQYDDLRHAVEQWNIALANRIVFNILPGRYQARGTEGSDGIRQPGLLFVRIDSKYPMVQGPGFTSTLALAVGGVRSGVIYVLVDRVAKRNLTGIAMHEMGHSLGSGHLEKGLMEPKYNPKSQRCIDVLTMNAVAQAQRVTFDKLNWCY
jgi:hypothetical protein